VASRTAPGFLEKILEGEIPEIGEGIIEVKAVSRQPGVRSKIAVVSHDENVEPIGSIVGVKGNRINRVSQQLNGEKIDVVK
jgi:N utilization substance protein A